MSDRLVLEGVPRVHFFEGGEECPEDITYPSCLRAWLQYVGDGYGCKLAPAEAAEWRPWCAYAYFVGLTGLGFWLGWDVAGDTGATGNALRMAADAAEPFRRPLEAIGYEHEIVLKESGATEADFRARILTSVEAGCPVIGLGVVGPPEACLVSGYDEGGDVLTGWSFFQSGPHAEPGLEFEPSGYFRKRNWFADTLGLIVIGKQGEKPPARETYRSALEWGLHAMRGPEVRGHASGLAAYRAWMGMLEDKANFADVNEATLRQRYEQHDFAVGIIAEARWYGCVFLWQVASQVPEWAQDLNAAAGCFEAQHDVMWGVWEYARHGEPSEHPKRLADPWIRERIHALVRVAYREDEEAARYIARALTR